MADTQPSSLLQYLPAIYREEPFLGHFLLAFEKLLFGLDDGRLATAAPSPALSAGEAEARELVRGHTIDRTYPGAPLALERTIASIATYFDPYKTPEDFLPWLASWTAFSLRADLTREKQRDFLANIIHLYRRRGTKENLIDLLTIFTIGVPTVTEEAADPPHRFTVELTLQSAAAEGVERRQIAIAIALVELEKPAHTRFELKPIFRGMQVGVTDHSEVGKTTLIGSAQT
jgi:phage tail-like protein